MRRFALLFTEIDRTTKTSEKVDAMVRYFADAPSADAAWAVYYLTGERPKRLIPARRLAEWARAEADVPEWLFDESYAAVGDLAETITLLLPDGTSEEERPLHEWIERTLLPLRDQEESEQRAAILGAWRTLRGAERFVWNKMITGAWRVGVSRQLVVRALATWSGVDEGTIAHRMSGRWDPTPSSFEALVAADTRDADRSRPYPFFLAYALETELDALGPVDAWQVEWKWDGIRAQVVRRGDAVHIWSRGEELVTDRFPEVAEWARLLPAGTVLDGEIMPWKTGEESPLPFAQLQRRIGRKVLGPKILADVPVKFVVYDLLEHESADVRQRPLSERRAAIERLVKRPMWCSPTVRASSWDDVRAAQADARARGAEGLMLKRKDAPYGVGRRKGGWWKWKVQPFSVDAVLIYAQAGSGRRASLHTDMTFAVWHEGALVPFAKAYSGLTDAELREMDAWIRRHTVEKFGPVRRVEPVHVFEIAFEGIQASSRHKAGVAVRFPRILRRREDKKPEEADQLATLRAMIEGAS